MVVPKWPTFEVIQFTQVPKTVDEIGAHFGGSYPVAKRRLARLVEEGVLEHTGKRRSSRYIAKFHSIEQCGGDKILKNMRSTPRGVYVVNELAEKPMTAMEISKELDVPIAATYRLLQQLVSLGFVTVWDRPLHRNKRVERFVAVVRYVKNRRLRFLEKTYQMG